MPTRQNPVASYLNSHFTVQLEGDHCRAAHGRESNDLRPIGTPAKVLIPIIRARIVERHYIPGEWLCGFDLGTFITATQTTRQPQVRFIIAAYAHAWDEVFDFELTRFCGLRQ